jgi:hypothetical protein
VQADTVAVVVVAAMVVAAAVMATMTAATVVATVVAIDSVKNQQGLQSVPCNCVHFSWVSKNLRLAREHYRLSGRKASKCLAVERSTFGSVVSLWYLIFIVCSCAPVYQSDHSASWQVPATLSLMHWVTEPPDLLCFMV